MNWSRTIRFDGELDDAQRSAILSRVPSDAQLRFAPSHRALARTYGLLEGSANIEPAEAAKPFSDARVYDETIIALAIEPTPADALQPIAAALGGAGAPSGVIECVVHGASVVVEFGLATAPSVVLGAADAELRRFNGHRRVSLLNPLSAEAVARIAATGLQAPQITADKILETLLEQTAVE